MAKKKYIFIVFILVINQQADREYVEVSFSLVLNWTVYQKSLWGDPPQFAIWISNEAKNEVITVAVTHRTAMNDWIGKPSCPVSLPIWGLQTKKSSSSTNNIRLNNVQVDAISGASFKISTYMKAIFAVKKKSTHQSVNQHEIDAITCATPIYNFRRKITIPTGSKWTYFIEVNCSGDYNNFYTSRDLQSGETDLNGNGQPSIIYRGIINTNERTISSPVLYGISDQHKLVTAINKNLESVTTAKNLLSKIKVEIVQ